MLIGLVAPPWLPVPPLRYGGTESIIDRLARGLVAAGHQVVLAAPSDSQCPAARVPGLPVADPQHIGHTLVEVPYVLAAYAALRDADVVHDHTLTGPLCASGGAVRIVTTNHGPFDRVLTPLYAEMSRRGVAVVAISHHQASTALTVPIATVIHHGIDVDAVPYGEGRGGYVCFVGRMSPTKGVREAILVARRAAVPLRIAAKMREEAERQYFDQQVRPLLGSDAEYVGELSSTEKYDLLGNASALLNPIQWPEPFGLTMIEALACGTPVVATRCGSVPEIVCDGVTGFIRKDLAALAVSLTQVANLDRRRCRQEAAAAFGADRMVADHLQLYARILRGRTGITSTRDPVQLGQA